MPGLRRELPEDGRLAREALVERLAVALRPAPADPLATEVVVVQSLGMARWLRQGLAEKRWELAMVHPAHISIEAMKHAGYRLVAVTKGFTEYKAGFMVRADATWTQVADLRGQRALIGASSTPRGGRCRRSPPARTG